LSTLENLFLNFIARLNPGRAMEKYHPQIAVLKRCPE
jgi:hypothetical protein